MKKDISSLHVPHNKHTAAMTPVRIDLPHEVFLPMNMHSGHDAEPIVMVGDQVRVGQLIAREEGRFSSPVHATVSGTVTEIGSMETAKGGTTKVIRIESDGKMEPDPSVKPPVLTDCDSFLAAVRESGMVGLGGAAFPPGQSSTKPRTRTTTWTPYSSTPRNASRTSQATIR